MSWFSSSLSSSQRQRSSRRPLENDNDNGDTAESSPLLVAPTARMRRSNNTSNNNNHQRGVIINRIGLLVLTILLGALALYSELQISQLSLQLEQDHHQLTQLQQTVETHERVIQRFNSSLTNHDVLDRLQQLELDLQHNTKEWLRALDDTQQQVAQQLQQTVTQLNTTVSAAELEISNQVDRVKNDVEQYVIATQDQFSMENSFMVYQLAGTFTLLSCLISMWHMSAHLRKLQQPQVQRKILAILWMSPIYAITSWFSLVFPSAEGYLAILKDFYEAYVIYQFLSFCIAVLGKGDRAAVVDLLAQHAGHLTPPFRLCSVWQICCPSCCRSDPFESDRQLADEILLQCQVFAMQFVFFRPLTTTAMVVLSKLQYYGPYGATAASDYRSPQFYIVIVQNISIFVAFTGLLKFYHAVDQELAWCRPFAKFLCIKGVVFMTFWQGLAISILAETTDLGNGNGSDPTEWAKSAQNFLICLEMLLFSIAHFYCFPTEEWEEGYRVKHSPGKFGDSIALGDFFDDLKLILKANIKKSKKRVAPPTIPESGRDDEKDDKDDDDENTSHTEEDEDEETGNARRSNNSAADEEADAERALVAALEKSLGAVNDDPDIVEAKRRLLQSNILSPEFFADDDEDEDDDETNIHYNKEEARQLWKEASLEEIDEDDNHPASDTASTTPGPNASDHDRQNNHATTDVLLPMGSAAPLGSPPPPTEPPPPPPTERTSLLMLSLSVTTPLMYTPHNTERRPSERQQQQQQDDGFLEALRPSIFTTVASIAEMERRRLEEESPDHHPRQP